jgi:hypothetical protein
LLNPHLQTQLFTTFVQASIAYWSNASAATTVSPVYPKPTSFESSLYMIVTGGNDLRGFTGNASAFPAFGAAVLASLRSTIQVGDFYRQLDFSCSLANSLVCFFYGGEYWQKAASIFQWLCGAQVQRS